MTWVAVGVGVAGAAAGAYGASKSASAAKAAGQAGVDSANQSNAIQLAMFNQQRADQLPFRNNGLMAQNQYMRMLGFDMSAPTYSADSAAKYLQDNPDVANDPYWSQHAYEHFTQNGRGEGRTWGTPTTGNGGFSGSQQQAAFDQFRNAPGYQFGLDEGFKQIQRSAAARSGLNSGAAMKELYKYGRDYSDAQGYRPYMNDLSNLFGGAQTATNAIGAAGQNYANQAGANLQAAGSARASGIIGAQNAWNNYYGQLANTGGQLAGIYSGRR